MKFLELIWELFLQHWVSILVVIALIVIVIVLLKRGEIKILEKILFALVCQAEKQFGTGTGELKYATVADWIYQRIPGILKIFFTSKDISKMIESALEKAKEAWGENDDIKDYIETPAPESIEAANVETYNPQNDQNDVSEANKQPEN